MTFPSPTPAPRVADTPRRRPTVLVPGRMRPSAVTIVAVAAVMAAIQLVNMLMDYRLNQFGVEPRTWHGLWGVLAAPLLHHGWAHLAANLIPLMIFGFLILIAGLRQFVAVTVLIWLLAGVGVWLTGPSGHVIVGSSTLVFGWLTFLVLRGVFRRSWAQIAMGVVLLAAWGGIYWGLLPGRDGISWQGHLFGALTGALAALLVAKADAPQRRAVGAGPASGAVVTGGSGAGVRPRTGR